MPFSDTQKLLLVAAGVVVLVVLVRRGFLSVTNEAPAKEAG